MSEIDPIESDGEFDDGLVCASCDYRRDGLPAESVCPECGTTHSLSLITLRGWSSRPMITWGRGQATRAIQAAIVVYLFILMPGICRAFFKGQGGDALVGVMFIVVAIAIALFLNIRLPAGRPPMRLRLSTDGYELRRRRTPLNLNAWQAANPAIVRPLGGRFWHMSVGWKDPLRSGGNELRFYWRGDAAAAERLRRLVDGFTQPLTVEQPPVYPQMI